MNTKACMSCGAIKPLSEFYKNNKMADGHINRCVPCQKVAAKGWYNICRQNPEWVEKEKRRGREKQRRLYRGKPTYKPRKSDYREKYPEKYAASIRSKRVPAPDGLNRHHWSYRKEHWCDVLFLSILTHNKYHRYMVYDQERMMYRTPSGVLLDTREAAEAYYATLEDKD